MGSTYPVHVGSAYREGSAGRRVNVSGPRECVLRPYPCCCAAGGPAVRRAPPPKRRHPKRRHQRPGRPPREEGASRARLPAPEIRDERSRFTVCRYLRVTSIGYNQRTAERACDRNDGESAKRTERGDAVSEVSARQRETRLTGRESE